MVVAKTIVYNLLRQDFVLKDGYIQRRHPVAAGSKQQCEITGKYRSLRWQGTQFKIHRLAYVLKTKRDLPPHVLVDHKDGNTKNNHVSNLRACNHMQNAFNSRTSKNNSTGIKGLSKHTTRSNTYWRVQVQKEGSLSCAYFPYTRKGKQEARAWLNYMRSRMHGKFARYD